MKNWPTPECYLVDNEVKILKIDISVLKNLAKTGFGKDKYWTFTNLGLIAAQCKGIAACSYF